MTSLDGVSVLLPVHAAADAGHLALALESLASQTLAPTEVIVVEDGPLRAEHVRVLDASPAAPLVRVTLPVNRGLGIALQHGLQAARGEWIARVDSDDVLVANRLERQMRCVQELDVDLCGTAMWEFDDDPTQPTRLRRCPATHEEIARRMRSNNPINHPTVVFRRETALSVGGYRELYGMEDYDLFARMLASGARMANLPEPLVLFRAGHAMLGRRSGLRFVAPELELQRRLYAYGLVGRTRAVVNFLARASFRLMPAWAKRVVYARLLSATPTR